MLIALATVYDLQIHQMDVKTAFLNGDLEEEIYMEQPESFVVPGKENKMCKLVKSLYGLKQAPKQWHEKFDQTMLANGFKINECDKCVYIKDTQNHQVIVCLYADDMLVINRDICDINATKRIFESKFDMKDLGVADVILGIRIHRTPQGLALLQSHYIEKVLDKFKDMQFGIAKTPLDVNFALRKNEGESDSQLEYARVLGCLMYIMNSTRSDIACAISKLSWYTSNPNKTHWMAMKRVLGYLKYTQNYALHYNKYPAVLEGYSDANWITGSNEVKSTSGYVFTIGGGAVSWKSSKQTCITRSTIESEFITLDKADEEAEWLRNFLEDIPYWPKPMAPVCIHCDSQAVTGRAGSMMYNSKSLHIRRRHNTVKKLLSSGIITTDYVKSKDNVSDPLTKGLSRKGVERTSKGMSLRPRTSQHCVPGMVGGMLLHCKSLRRFEHNDGWIKALLEEAENERMHLMTFMEVSKPKWADEAHHRYVNHFASVVGLWHFGWSSILLQVTEKVMANKDTKLVVTNQIGSLGNENVGSNEEIQKLRQQMIEMHRAWANGFPPPPFPDDNLEYLSSLPPVSHA
ncbi:hypothetical protein CQW23_00687 [Capsicum baccatum]|uniref:Ubiquinol oxidase n=1 Tax=Capsicum baccatum TaxID=33114 RepID=A0A2G2XLE5_CAPBA|nr:hypothetical protein CQW23_00687 [Capsicum baccatum]